MLRDVRIDGRPAYAAVGFLVRDDVWNTVPTLVEQFGLEQGADAVRVHLQLAHRGFGLDVGATVEMTVGDGQLHLAVEAVTNKAGRFNRIGLVVLHPMPESVGARYRIEHCDGAVSEGTFAEAIAPSPVFKSVRAMTHSLAAGVWCTCAFTGEDFETEDQRAFSDASLKTYSRSNALPRPMALAAGERINQAVTLTWSGAISRGPRSPDSVAVGVGEASGLVMPAIGVMIGQEPLPGDDIATVVEESGARFVLCRVDQAFDDGRAKRVVDAVKRCDRPIVLEIDGTAEPAAALVERAASIFHECVIEEVRLSPFSADLARLARARFGDVGIGAASSIGLVGLLRSNPPEAANFMAFATSAIIHDADGGAVMATTRSLPAMLRAARSHGRLPVRLGPSTIALLRHPHAPAPVDSPPGAEWPMAATSPLMDRPFAAAWAAALVAEAAGLSESICLFTTHGPNGLIDRPGRARPLQPVFAALAYLSGCRLLVATNSDPARIACLAVTEEGMDLLILANRTGDAVPVRVAMSAERVEMRSLARDGAPEPEMWTAAARDSFRLDGHEVVCMRWRH